MTQSISIPFYKKTFPDDAGLYFFALNDFYRQDETTCIQALLKDLSFTKELAARIEHTAIGLIQEIRSDGTKKSAIEQLMLHYDLSTEEGVLLMCLAEALLRIPDKEVEMLLIHDKLTAATWENHIAENESFFVSSAIWGLALSGKILQRQDSGHIKDIWHRLIQKSGEPIIRAAVRKVMRLMSELFVLGNTMPEALKRVKSNHRYYRYSYDMLGEAACTMADANEYYQAYHDAIQALSGHTDQDIYAAPSISVKLSALHPRYEFSKRETVLPFLVKQLKALALSAKKVGISITIDAEEADRLELSLDIFMRLFRDPDFTDWSGLGLVVQAYQKRAFPLLSRLIALAREQGRRIPIRLVKGAYWDTEIKRTQVEGYENYPVFTRKVNTDISYLVCVQQMLDAKDAIYPQFATHNAYSVAAILAMDDVRGSKRDFELQHLQGMGQALYDYLTQHLKLKCRVYAPVGPYQHLLPYLVRRLLENGANSSFVNKISDRQVPISELVENPAAQIMRLSQIPHPKIPLPVDLFGSVRKNSKGLDLTHAQQLLALAKGLEQAEEKVWTAVPSVQHDKDKKGQAVENPADHRKTVGNVTLADLEDVDVAVSRGTQAFLKWNALGVTNRADTLRKTADLLEAHYADLIMLIVREAGRTVSNALSEVREAVDFCRYYAEEAENNLADKVLPSYTGELDILRMHGRGVILCISPWNFPAAIYTGQIAAALVTGNAVIAKPSAQTPLIAALIAGLFHEAGVPSDILQLLPGSGRVIGQALIEHPHVAGVIFTGSNEVAHTVQKTLADRPGPIVPFVAETSGINAMIADSTILPQQLIHDVIMSAFDSAGQRCSALRILLIQEDVADTVIPMLAGAMAEITVGDPMLFATDVGPVIDESSKKSLLGYVDFLEKQGGKLIYRVPLPEESQYGSFVAPAAYELPSLALITQEVFGPILHVVRYKFKDLDRVIDEINQLGYGLTFGIQSRIDRTVDYIQKRINAGNIYVNRNIVGAVVGMQPFGGGWLSGTGPKAGGPHYLSRFCIEKTLTIDTTAAGGNASLMAMEDSE